MPLLMEDIFEYSSIRSWSQLGIVQSMMEPWRMQIVSEVLQPLDTYRLEQTELVEVTSVFMDLMRVAMFSVDNYFLCEKSHFWLRLSSSSDEVPMPLLQIYFPILSVFLGFQWLLEPWGTRLHRCFEWQIWQTMPEMGQLQIAKNFEASRVHDISSIKNVVVSMSGLGLSQMALRSADPLDRCSHTK